MIDQRARDEFDAPYTTSARYYGVRLSARSIPVAGANAGANWCEAYPVASNVIALSIGEIGNHGAQTWETMFVVRQTIRDATSSGSDPAQALGLANRIIRRCEPGETAMAIVALLNTRTRSMMYANAGHSPPLMAGPCGTLFLDHAIVGTALGADPNVAAEIHSVNTPAATLFVFCSDAVRGPTTLRAAAAFARDFPEIPSAAAIEALARRVSRSDNAAILTAWTPHSPMLRRRQVRSRAALTCGRSERRWRNNRDQNGVFS